MRIAEAPGKDFEIASVRIAAHDHPLVRVMVLRAIPGRDAGANIADAPVEFAIGPHDGPRHAVPPEADMDHEAGCQGFFGVEHLIAVGIGEAPQVGGYPHIDFLVGHQQGAGHIRNFFGKVVQDAGRHISHAIPVGVFEAPDLVFLHGQVTPVVYGVVVQVFEPAVLVAFLGGKGFPQEGPPVFHRLQADRSNHPVAVAADVEFGVFLPVGPRQVHPPHVVDVHGHGVRGQGIGGPQAQLQPICHPGRHPGAGGAGQDFGHAVVLREHHGLFGRDVGPGITRRQPGRYPEQGQGSEPHGAAFGPGGSLLFCLHGR